MQRSLMRKMWDFENTPAMSRSKVALLRMTLLLLIAFCFVMLWDSLRQGYFAACYAILAMIAILAMELLAIILLKKAPMVCMIGNILLLTVLFLILILNPGSYVFWFLFLAVPPFALYIAGLIRGFLVVLYGGILLGVLLWSPLRQQIPDLDVAQMVASVYVLITLSCLSVSYSLTKSQLAQQDETRKIGARLREASERRRIDRLTGLLNRDWAEDEIAPVLASGSRNALFFMDIDNFKLVNDLLGHQAGDQYLASFAQLLQDVFGNGAVPIRLGGDEFLVFVPKYESVDLLRSLAETLLRRAKQLCSVPQLSDKLGISIGIALAPEDGTDFESLYRCADKSQYYIKRNGKRGYAFYSKQPNMEFDFCAGANISTLMRMVRTIQDAKGILQVEYGVFRQIYQFLVRNLPRDTSDTQLMLLTILTADGCIPGDYALEVAYAALEDSLHLCLRAGDLMMGFTKNQIAVLLVNCSSQDCVPVAQRILATYREQAGDADGLWVRYESESLREEDRSCLV